MDWILFAKLQLVDYFVGIFVSVFQFFFLSACSNLHKNCASCDIPNYLLAISSCLQSHNTTERGFVTMHFFVNIFPLSSQQIPHLYFFNVTALIFSLLLPNAHEHSICSNQTRERKRTSATNLCGDENLFFDQSLVSL